MNGDLRAFYSNVGPCVDLFAPGDQIVSASIADDVSFKTLSGTSMAAPHVAGVAALILQTNPSFTPTQVTAQILAQSSVGVLNADTLQGSINLLLNSSPNGASAPSPTPSPTPIPTESIAVKSIVGTASKSGSNWLASFVISVYDINTGASVSGVTVSGSLSTGGIISCVTGSNGSCSSSSTTLKSRSVGSVTYTISNISGNSVIYSSSKNLMNQVTVNRP